MFRPVTTHSSLKEFLWAVSESVADSLLVVLNDQGQSLATNYRSPQSHSPPFRIQQLPSSPQQQQQQRNTQSQSSSAGIAQQGPSWIDVNIPSGERATVYEVWALLVAGMYDRVSMVTNRVLLQLESENQQPQQQGGSTDTSAYVRNHHYNQQDKDQEHRTTGKGIPPDRGDSRMDENMIDDNTSTAIVKERVVHWSNAVCHTPSGEFFACISIGKFVPRDFDGAMMTTILVSQKQP
ncbi:hypothetical protein Pelo_6421 [Pelomyxa schiedti]|nr:hypothetical protein Pelo_6421 [Pelomyxa schiedti]